MKKILLFLVVVSLVISFVPAQANEGEEGVVDSSVIDGNTGIENENDYLPMPIPAPNDGNIVDANKIIYLIVGEEKKISDDISLKLVKLMEADDGFVCTRTNPEPCFSYIEIKMNDLSKRTVVDMGKFYPISSFYPTVPLDFKIGLIGKKDYQTGIFEIRRKGDIDVNVLVTEIIKTPDIDLEKDIISISEEEISIKEINEGGEVIKIAPKSGVKQVILIEKVLDEDKVEGVIPEQYKEVFVGTSEGVVSIEIVKGATKEDCEMYKEECDKLSDENACIKWDSVCKAPDYSSNQCSKILSLCNEGDEGACKKYSIACKIISSATTKEVLNIKENKIFMNEKEIKVMPDTASESAIEKLSLNKDVEIELKDTGKPVYEVVGSQEKRILGLFKTAVKVTTTLSAETGEIEKTKKPWWSFLAW